MAPLAPARSKPPMPIGNWPLAIACFAWSPSACVSWPLCTALSISWFAVVFSAESRVARSMCRFAARSFRNWSTRWLICALRWAPAAGVGEAWAAAPLPPPVCAMATPPITAAPRVTTPATAPNTAQRLVPLNIASVSSSCARLRRASRPCVMATFRAALAAHICSFAGEAELRLKIFLRRCKFWGRGAGRGASVGAGHQLGLRGSRGGRRAGLRGQRHREGAAGSRPALHPDRAVQLVHNPGGDREAESGALAVARRIGAIKAVEDAALIRLGDADARIANGHAQRAVLERWRDRDQAAGRGVF